MIIDCPNQCSLCAYMFLNREQTCSNKYGFVFMRRLHVLPPCSRKGDGIEMGKKLITFLSKPCFFKIRVTVAVSVVFSSVGTDPV